LRERTAPTLLTPHPGELARLLATTVAAVESDRLAAARDAARRSGATVLLKGHLSVVADPGGSLAVNPTGNPGLASGGAGDVLTGLVAALLAQRLAPYDAACLGAYLHGLAADLLMERGGGVAIPAGELVAALPAAFEALWEGEEEG